MSKFKSVSSQVNLPALEEEISKFWRENHIFQKSIDQRSSDNLYTFVDGPPFVSGLPHYGHLLTSIAKDMMPRYQTMKGKKVRRVFGWDCHGLPIEEKVSRQFGIKNNMDLEECFTVEKYVQECRKFVQNCTDEWRWYIEKIGRWVDMDNAYYTMDINFMESVIWGFKNIYEKGFIYKGKRISLFSTDTSTPVSNFEVAMDPDNYQDVEDTAIFIKFKLTKEIDGKTVYFIAWTTTPWTIPSNFALAVNKNFQYVLVEYDDEYFIVAKDRLDYTFEKSKRIKVLKEFPGAELEGIDYQPVYDFFADQKTPNDFKVYFSDDVLTDEGTGVLHIAPAFGEVDFQMGQKHNLSAISDIDNQGNMNVGSWGCLYLRDASPLIVEDLVAKNVLLRTESYIHRLPFYRGKNPLIYMLQDAYFINVQAVKERMLELNTKINWIPEHLKTGRFAQTIETSPDWCISRNRYWATIMPIWKSEDGEEIVVGSIEEMMKYSDQISKKDDKYFFKDQPMDLHRDICDQIIFTKDGKTYKRIPEVLDCWMDSGSVPFAEYHYPFENKEIFEKSRPADFIIEYMPQVRAWFSVLLRVSTILFDDSPFKNAVSHGTVAGTDGRKMSKSYGNYPDPKMVLDKYGADALRAYFMSSPIMRGEDMSFSEEGVAENYKFLLIFWNSYKFFVDYALLNDWTPNNLATDRQNILDRWIISKLSKLTLDLQKSFEQYDTPKITSLLKGFIVEEFSTWYIRRSRDRFSPEHNDGDRNMALGTMYEVLTTLTKLAAPLLPFITEEIYKNLTGEESVHLSDYPTGSKSKIDVKLMEDMGKVRQLVELGHAKRKEVGIKLRQPLATFSYSLPEKLDVDLEQIMADELNVKNIEYRKTSEGEPSGELNTNITQELQVEGEVRELIRNIQKIRKEKGLTLKDRIIVSTPNLPADKKFVDLIVKQTNADGIKEAGELAVEVV